jgi:hypothetical protein
VASGCVLACSTASQDVGNNNAEAGNADSGEPDAGRVEAGIADGGNAPSDAQSRETSTPDGHSPSTEAGTGTSADAAPTPTPTKLVLFGGRQVHGGLDGRPEALSDTWTWDGTAWALRGVSGPSARYGSAIANAGGNVVLYGGAQDYDGVSQQDLIFGETWLWDGVHWNKYLGDSKGWDCDYATAASLGDGNVLLFGGWAMGAYAVPDTFVWDGSAWSQVSGPGPSGRSGAAAASFQGKVVLYGGSDTNDTWTWDGSWHAENPAHFPTPMTHAAMGTLNDKVVLFGDTGETWSWDGADWTNLHVSGPGARYCSASAVLDGRLFIFGGTDGGNDFGDTWAFDGTSWSQVSTTGPAERECAAMSAY